MKITVWKITLFGGLFVFSLLFWLNDHVGYSATSALLVNGHNGNQDEVLAQTVAAFAQTETFTERTLGSTRLQEGVVGQLSPEEQVRALKATEVRGGGKKGGLVLITVENTDTEIAEILSMESTETLLRMSRLYLGDEKEFTSTVIDTAIVEKNIIQTELYVLKSVVTALMLFAVILLFQPALLFLFQQVQILTQKILGTRKKESEKMEEISEPLDQRFVPQKLDPTFLYSTPEVTPDTFPPLPKATDVVNSEVYGKSPLQSVSVSLEDLPFTFETPKEESKEVVVEVEEPAAEKEPTMLEYKRRLNELLAQK